MKQKRAFACAPRIVVCYTLLYRRQSVSYIDIVRLGAHTHIYTHQAAPYYTVECTEMRSLIPSRRIHINWYSVEILNSKFICIQGKWIICHSLLFWRHETHHSLSYSASLTSFLRLLSPLSRVALSLPFHPHQFFHFLVRLHSLLSSTTSLFSVCFCPFFVSLPFRNFSRNPICNSSAFYIFFRCRCCS